jgi:putative flavoprotein involved in K+ transport
VAELIDVVVIGGGQAGLATSYELTQAGVEHVVLERGRIGQSWRGRWDSFCLVTPNWTVQLPGFGYDGDDPDGYLPRDEIVTHLERYAGSFEAPVRAEAEVASLEPDPGGGFVLRVNGEELRARSVVVATGAYQRPHRPPTAASLPDGILQLDADDYRNPRELPDGQVLVIGSGQSGCQIAEELVDWGRETFLSCGRAPWAPRRIGEHDLMWWVIETGFVEQPVEALPSPSARLFANVLGTGRDGGHDINLRTLRELGVTLLGRFRDAYGGEARFAPDLLDTADWGDLRYREFRQLCWDLADERGIDRPNMPEPDFFDRTMPESLDLSDVGAVIFAGGFRPDYGSWVHVPGAFDPLGFPVHEEGRSTAAPELYFVGVHFLRKRKSSLLWGVREDAAIVAAQIATARAKA